MKMKFYLTFVGCVLSGALCAQMRSSGKIPFAANTASALYNPINTPVEVSVPDSEYAHHPFHKNASSRSVPEEVVGTTFWDAQSYGGISPRIYAAPNGDPVATWMFSNNTAHTVRGTGYSVRTGGIWSPVSANLETIRTGFPSAAILGDGSEIVICHTTATTPWKLWVTKKSAGSSTWTESSIPGPSGGIRMLWPKIAVGGPDNMTVHVIGITAQVGGTTGGVVYQGMNGHILYYRSTDGGATWDKQNVVVPGLDSTRYDGFSADTYTIDASGNTVAIGIFSGLSWKDIRLFKSTDNGENWSDIIVYDFPDAVEDYTALPGNSYTSDDVPLDTTAFDSLAVMTNDGFGSVLIDPSGQAHVWFGKMHVTDLNFDDSTYSYYPQTNGLMYWKESFGTSNPQLLTGALDYDSDGAIGIASLEEIAPYGTACISSFPVTGIDENGTIYLAYSALHELYRTNTGDVNDEFYRHLYLMKSTDNGDTWGEPLEISAPPYVEDFIAEFIECVYPAIPRHIGEKVWVLYQQDFAPGSAVWGEHHELGETAIMWVEVEPADIPVSIFNPPSPDLSFDLLISPNPAASVAQLTANFEGSAPALIEVFDLMGNLVQQYRLPQNGTGRQTMTLPVQNLQTGTYMIRVTQGGRFGIAKLLKI
jgi:hypothetical protein